AATNADLDGLSFAPTCFFTLDRSGHCQTIPYELRGGHDNMKSPPKSWYRTQPGDQCEISMDNVPGADCLVPLASSAQTAKRAQRSFTRRREQRRMHATDPLERTFKVADVQLIKERELISQIRAQGLQHAVVEKTTD